MTTLLGWLATRRRVVLLAVAVLVLILLGVGAVASHRTTHDRGRAQASPATRHTHRLAAAPDRAGSGGDPTTATHSLTGAEQAAVAGSIDWLRSMAPVAPRTSKAHPAISDENRSQPDLYAAALVRGLLTQDYASPRADLLAWVKAQSAPTAEPTVVGLIPPPLRPRLAVASVQEGFDGPGPVPTRGVWDALAARHAASTVLIQRVSEPVNWSAALAAGQISDPGVTAREVDAQVTTRATLDGHRQTTVTSVALIVNLEGPPVREHYGFVTVVDYTSTSVSS